MVTAILLYLMVAAFLAGWWFGADWALRVERRPIDQIGILGCCIAWPFTLFVIFKLWKECKL